MKRFSAKDYVVAVLVLLPLPVLWFLLFYRMAPASAREAGFIVVGTTFTYMCLLVTIVFKRLPKEEQELVEISSDILHEIKRTFYENFCVSCCKTCRGIETTDVANCPHKEEYFEAKYRVSLRISEEEDKLDSSSY